MEHRLSARAAFNTNVAIYYSSLGLLPGRAVDISRHGIFVRTGRLTLPLHALVEIAFLMEQGSDEQPRRASAMVVRVADDGIGLMFGDALASSGDEAEGNGADDSLAYGPQGHQRRA